MRYARGARVVLAVARRVPVSRWRSARRHKKRDAARENRRRLSTRWPRVPAGSSERNGPGDESGGASFWSRLLGIRRGCVVVPDGRRGSCTVTARRRSRRNR